MEIDEVPKLGSGANWKGMATAVGVVALGCLGVFIYLYIESHTGLQGQVSDLADEMCECKTGSCAQDVATRYDSWISVHRGEMVDIYEDGGIQANIQRLQECVNGLHLRPFAP